MTGQSTPLIQKRLPSGHTRKVVDRLNKIMAFSRNQLFLHTYLQPSVCVFSWIVLCSVGIFVLTRASENVLHLDVKHTAVSQHSSDVPGCTVSQHSSNVPGYTVSQHSSDAPGYTVSQHSSDVPGCTVSQHLSNVPGCTGSTGFPNGP